MSGFCAKQDFKGGFHQEVYDIEHTKYQFECLRDSNYWVLARHIERWKFCEGDVKNIKKTEKGV